MIDRIPVDLRRFAIGEPLGQHIEEHLLLMPVIPRVAGRKLALPVERQPHRPQLALHCRDVLARPAAWIDLAFYGGIFRWHPERIPPHRMQHVEPACPLISREHIAHRVVAHVAHVNAP